MTQGRARGQILDIFKKCLFILLTCVDILPTLIIFIFGITHGLLPLDYLRYMVTCKSSKSRTSLDFMGMGEFGLGQKGRQLWIYMPLKTLFQLFDPLTKRCLIFWLLCSVLLPH